MKILYYEIQIILSTVKCILYIMIIIDKLFIFVDLNKIKSFIILETLKKVMDK